MGMIGFHHLFPDIAEKEMRTAEVRSDPVLPPDTYLFVEFYCVDPDCDCRRVMLNVASHKEKKHLATISHAFDIPRSDAPVPEQTFLDPMNVQTEYSKPLLNLFLDVVLEPIYDRRLERHYQIVKEAVADPSHPIHEIIASASPPELPTIRVNPKIGRNAPCPCGSGKKYKKCCLMNN